MNIYLYKDCKSPKREKGMCFKYGEKGHVISECTGKSDTAQINHVYASSNEFQEEVNVKINDFIANYDIKIQ